MSRLNATPSAVIRKAQPDLAAVHTNRPLTNISTAYMQDPRDYFAHRIFHGVPVAKKSDTYYTYAKGFAFRNAVKKRAPNAESSEMGYELTPAQYDTDIYGVHIDVPWEVQANADGPVLNPDQDAAEMVADQQLLNKDVIFKETFLKVAVWGKDVPGVAAGEVEGTDFRRFSDKANSDPIEVIRFWKRYVKQRTGKWPRHLAVAQDVFDVLVDHPDIIDRIKYSTQTNNAPAVANEQTIAAVMGLDEIVVMSSVNNTAKEGVADVMGFISSNEMLLYYKPPRPGLKVLAAGYEFQWTGYAGAGGSGVRTLKMPVPLKHSNRVETEAAWGMRAVSTDVAVYFHQVLTA